MCNWNNYNTDDIEQEKNQCNHFTSPVDVVMECGELFLRQLLN